MIEKLCILVDCSPFFSYFHFVRSFFGYSTVSHDLFEFWTIDVYARYTTAASREKKREANLNLCMKTILNVTLMDTTMLRHAEARLLRWIDNLRKKSIHTTTPNSAYGTIDRKCFAFRSWFDRDKKKKRRRIKLDNNKEEKKFHAKEAHLNWISFAFKRTTNRYSKRNQCCM